MPMHYPPLADGTYRFGDPPRPKPSPVPGPDPAASADPIAPAEPGTPAAHLEQPHHPAPPTPGPPGQSPPPAPDPAKKRSDGLAAAAIVGAAALVVVVILGLALFSPGGDRTPTDLPRGPLPQAGPPPAQSPGSASFGVDGTFTVVSSPSEPVSGDPTGCDLPPTLTDIGEGTPISLLESNLTTLSTTRLAYEGGDLASCTFTFEFADVPAGVAVYVIELPGRGQLLYTEEELRAGVDITLGR